MSEVVPAPTDTAPTDAPAVPVEEATVTETAKPTESFIYQCRKCRRVLFSTADLIPHDTDGEAPGHKAFSKPSKGKTAAPTPGCTSVFVDPDKQDWVRRDLKGAEPMTQYGSSDLVCPHCAAKIGSRCWAGEQCSCGFWVTPSFKVSKSRLDESAAP